METRTSAISIPSENGENSPEQVSSPFYNYPGARDYWRFPLVYPYQVSMIDQPSVGTISRYLRMNEDGQIESEPVSGKIVFLFFNRKCAVYLEKSRNDPGEEWRFLEFKSGRVFSFSSFDKLKSFLETHPEMLNLNTLRLLPIESHYKTFLHIVKK